MHRLIKITAIVALTAIFILSTAYVLLIQPLKIRGESMSPNFIDRQKTWIVKTPFIHRFDVVAFDASQVDKSWQTGSEKTYIKRIIGMPGEQLLYTKDGELWVNGVIKTRQAFLYDNQQKTGTLLPNYTNLDLSEGFTLSQLAKLNNWQTKGDTIPENMYFVMGDNRSESVDSRTFGYVPKEAIIGSVIPEPFKPNPADFIRGH